MLGKKIRQRREQLGITSQQLAELANVSQAYISQLENGHRQPSYNTLQAIAYALNSTADFLLTNDIQAGSITDSYMNNSSDGGSWVAREKLNLTTLVDYAAAVEKAHNANVTPEDLVDAVEALIKLKRLRQ